MTEPLWQPAADRIRDSNMGAFARLVEARYGFPGGDYGELHRWSIEAMEDFWQAVHDFSGIEASRPRRVVDDPLRLPGARWFEGAELNFAENLLRPSRDPVTAQRNALIFCGENGARRAVSYGELYEEVSRLSRFFQAMGIGPGDRIAACLPNCIESVSAMLATSAIGAVWSSCSPDFGVDGVVDRFRQIQPKLLIATDGYFYNGRTIDLRTRVAVIAARIESLQGTVIVPFAGLADSLVAGANPTRMWPEILDEYPAAPIPFVRLPFDHPLYILFSSGTTGVPKCIVHGAGGTLLQHRKEHLLHTDLKADDCFFYYTTCGWMMWNWLVSGLASGATLLLYDGSPLHPTPSALWDIAEQEGVSLFGVSARYLAALEKQGVEPAATHRLQRLRTLLSTGSVLAPESYDYVYRAIKQDLCLASISGGTDIVSCFVLGNPLLPVYRGEIQCRGLGMAVEFFDEHGHPATGRKGELVCTHAFPSCPLGFWNDVDGTRFREAYFRDYGGTVWVHGDYGELTQRGGVVLYGRSDAVLNPRGVRIGTAEIYRQVEKLDEVLESVCIGQRQDNDEQVLLFVVLRDGLELTPQLERKIRSTIRRETTPRHVPARILAVADIPRTRNGKTAELAVRSAVHGEPVRNIEALANPEALDWFRELAADGAPG